MLRRTRRLSLLGPKIGTENSASETNHSVKGASPRAPGRFPINQNSGLIFRKCPVMNGTATGKENKSFEVPILKFSEFLSLEFPFYFIPTLEFMVCYSEIQ